jgi:hypothetical protein
MRLKSIIMLLFLAILLHADVMYEMTTKTTGMMGMGDSETFMRIFIKGDRSRTEVKSTSTTLGDLASTYIMRLDKSVMWTIDDTNKKFMETGLNFAVDDSGMSRPESTLIKPDVKIEFTDETKKILDHNCRKINVSLKLNGDANDFNLTQTMWMAESLPGVDELKAYNNKLIEVGGGMMQSAPMGVDKKALEEFMNKTNEINGFPLEIEFTMSINVEEMVMEVKTSSVVTKFSVVPISNKVFELPEGYTPYE